MEEQDIKIKEMVVLFEKIVELFPKGNVNMSIHRIDIQNLDTNIWEIKANYKEESKEVYLIAQRKEKGNLDIDLYGESKKF